MAPLAAYDATYRRRQVRPIIELLLITGARLGEVLGLRSEDVEGGYVRFVDTKNGRPRRLCPLRPRWRPCWPLCKDPMYAFVSGRTGSRYNASSRASGLR
jgi:integrase